jgi:hypothetical protein
MPVGSGTTRAFHVMPFQVSVIASEFMRPLLGVPEPKATQLFADRHATELSATDAFSGSGTVTVFHFVPFHSSASGEVRWMPTAMHILGVAHETV